MDYNCTSGHVGRFLHAIWRPLDLLQVLQNFTYCLKGFLSSKIFQVSENTTFLCTSSLVTLWGRGLASLRITRHNQSNAVYVIQWNATNAQTCTLGKQYNQFTSTWHNTGVPTRQVTTQQSTCILRTRDTHLKERNHHLTEEVSLSTLIRHFTRQLNTHSHYDSCDQNESVTCDLNDSQGANDWEVKYLGTSNKSSCLRKITWMTENLQIYADLYVFKSHLNPFTDFISLLLCL